MLRSIKQKNIKAYTLIEIIVTTVLLTVGFLGIFAAFNFGSKNALVTDKKLLAANKGRELLEDLRAKTDERTWDSPWSLTCPGSGPWPDGATFDGNPILYTCTVDDSEARKVTITLNWTD